MSFMKVPSVFLKLKLYLVLGIGYRHCFSTPIWRAVVVIGLLAAASSIAKTVKTAVRLAKLLHHAAKHSSTFGDHMRGFAVTFQNFARVVRLTMRALQDSVATILTRLLSKVS
jgi:hypothetical protein